MGRHGRLESICLALLVLVGVALPPAELWGQPPTNPPELLEDSQLADVVFLDPDRGWAVGDRGVIWHTDNGGRQWRQQPSGVQCRLNSIHFVDNSNGWIVGGWTHPFTHASTAVVLRTTNGGRTWIETPELTLPALKQVRFFDGQHGIGVGNGSAMYPSGIFRTADGGRSWQPLPAGSGGAWLSGDFRDERSGAVAGCDGQLGVVVGDELRVSRTPDLGTRHLRQLVLAGSVGGWLVGDTGLVLRTDDGGLTWQAPAGTLPEGAAQQFDFSALAVRGDHCWIAGSPGTCVFHSPDGGESWQRCATGQALPLRSLTFLDDQRGWAVGDMGSILATRDGGRTWRKQHLGGTRAAVMAVFSQPDRIPLELFALWSGDEGYLAVVEILNRRDLDVPAGVNTPLDERLHEALVATGVSVAAGTSRFPLRQLGLQQSRQSIIDGWNRATDGQAVPLIEQHVVRKIRQWRPEVIVTEPASPLDERPLAHLVNQLVLQSAQRAGDPAVYADQITVGGLEPWRVKKVYCTVEPDDQGTVTITTSQLATRLGRSLVDQSAHGKSLLARELQPVAPTIGLRLLVNELPGEIGRQGVFSGITLQPGGEARRRLSPPAAADLAALSRAAKWRRNIEQLLARQNPEAGGGAAWLGQVDDLTRGMDSAGSGAILFQLAQRYQRRGQSELSAELLERLIDEHPEHPLSDAALVWLIRYYTSGEIAWKLRRGTRFAQQAIALEQRVEQPVRPQQASLDVAARVQTARNARYADGSQGPVERAGRAAELGKLAQQSRPALFADPVLRFPLAAAHRAAGLPAEAARHYRTIAGSGLPESWRRTAEAELWLEHAAGLPPKPVIDCVTATSRPRLDGKLDDAVWAVAKRMELKSSHHDDHDWPATVLLSHDQQFLYVAISCRKSAALDYSAGDAPRPRDADLGARDRVELLIDIDRDYATYYRLSIDDRGWTAEDILADSSWDPTWYVAASQNESQWTAEVAVPLDELSQHAPGVRDAWAVGVQRTVPNVGFQSWTEPAAIEPLPEGFGYLIFK